MLHSYESATTLASSVLGLGALTLGYSWFTYRLTTLIASESSQGGFVDLGTGVYTYFWFLLPWGVVLHTVRGYTGFVCGAGLGYDAVATQRVLLGLQVGVLLVVSLRWAQQTSTRWVLELLAAWLLLQLCWILLSQAYTLLTALLWLEVASLGGVLLLSTATLGFSEVRSTLAWRGAFFSRQLQLGFLYTILVFLWTSGFATLFLLLGLCYGFLILGGYGLDVLLVVSSFGGLAAGSTTTALVVCLGGGVLIKLLLQPMQFALVTFYRNLRLEVFVFYLVSYYVCFIPLLFTVLYPQIALLLGGWGTYLLALVCLASCALARGGTAGGDLRTTLAYSTAVSLTLFLVVVTLF